MLHKRVTRQGIEEGGPLFPKANRSEVYFDASTYKLLMGNILNSGRLRVESKRNVTAHGEPRLSVIR